MPEYLSPGVYMEEVEIGSRPIEGVSTSTAGFVGVTEWGPTEGLPELVTSFADYQRKFGGFLDEETWGNSRFLPYAVQGFFQNGGQRAYIKRVVGKKAAKSAIKLNSGIVTSLKADFLDSDPGLKTAILVSLRGISTGTDITLTEVDRNEQKHELQLKVVSYNEDTKEVTFLRDASTGYKFSKSGTRVIVGQKPSEVNIDIKARNEGKWGDRINLMVEHSSKGYSTAIALNEDIKRTFIDFPKLSTDLKLKGRINPTTAEISDIELENAADLRVGDRILFGSSNQDKSFVKEISAIKGNIITVKSPFVKGDKLEVEDTVISLLTAVRFIPLALAENAAKGDQKIKLSDASSLKVGDSVNLTGFGGATEVVEVTSVDANEITIKSKLSSAYVVDMTYVYYITGTIKVNDASLFEKGSSVTIASSKTPDVCVRARIDSITASGNLLSVTFAKPQELENIYFYKDDIIECRKVAKKNDKSIRVASIGSFYTGAVIELDNGWGREYNTIQNIDEINKILYFDSALSGTYVEGNKIRTCEYKFTINLIPGKDIKASEVYDNVSMNKLAKNYFAGIINNSSALVTVTDNEGDLNVIPVTASGAPVFLQSGSNGELPSAADYIGSEDAGPGKRTGIKSLEDIDDISIVAVPGITYQDVHNELINHCEIVMKDRFAVLDTDRGLDIKEVRAQRGLYNTNYASIYYPWLKINDPLVQRPADIPPSGHIAGIYARSDVQRGVHKAPANELIQGIIGLEVQINKGENDVLNYEGINAIRAFPGRGILVWGARTMTDNSLWKYINVRRLFLFIEESIKKNTQWVVFEPNNEKLWARVKLTITQFLTTVWRDGALMGTKESEAFFVKCDRTTMTQSDIDNGRLIVEIGVAPVKPAEFVIFRIAQWDSGSNISE